VETDLDRDLEKALAALLAGLAPEARVQRIRWSQGETQVVELGSGSPLLYVHGGLGGAYELVPILAALAEGHRVLAVDRPGHGLADPFDYRDVDLLECPSRVSRLLLVGAPFGIMRSPPRLMLPLGFPLIGPRLGRYLFSNATQAASRKFWGQVMVDHPERLDDRLLDVDVAHTRRNAESMLSLIACIADWRRLGYRRELILGERWQALTVPTLLLWPEHDAFGSPEAGEALVATNPNLRLVRLPAAGHLPWIDDPDNVVAEMERFLATERRSGVDAVP
jgi:pimeloyl-ACP methyl ester carboxylesterase